MMKYENYNLKDLGQMDLGLLELDDLDGEKRPVKGTLVGWG